MDLGCIDMGCVEKPRKEESLEKDTGPKEEALMSASKSAKDAVRSSLNALTKITSQISKPPRRKTSPVNWFPRKKVEPYLKRKIKMLQEVDGMQSTLDETLGDSNPHYSRVLREKIAIREAAEKAMEARKSAMVEASWCRILQAARIESKEAEAQLAKAEKSASEASEAARALGVIMDDAQNHYQIEASGGPTATSHTVSATFETAFEVDKQVAAAVKDAFIKLASCPSINKEEFKDLLRKISENPENGENLNMSDFTVDCESGITVDMMLDRLRCLKEEELSSLATIVATRGLNAALSEKGNNNNSNNKRYSLSSSSSSSIENAENSRLKAQSRRMSVGGRRSSSSSDAEIPSLDKFLVKRLTRLERDVLEAKNARKTENENKLIISSDEKVPDLGTVLVKHASKLEKEVEGAKTGDNRKIQRGPRVNQDFSEVPSLDKYLVKHLTRLEREVEEAKNGEKSFEAIVKTASFSTDKKGKENVDTNKTQNKDTGSNVRRKGGDLWSYYGESLDKVLVKHVSRYPRTCLINMS
ncbi:Unknown protein [Striga hermonthica]|uniref:Uncharacterized protein n=1 Tax=Striga hermonthica TaxID=68872 RepID=A0A9N7MD62_STRHE|nr:Unknown protein [Striga hermonthica]